MKKLLIGVAMAVLLSGCSRRPMVIEYYPPMTEEQLKTGYGPVKMMDYRKPYGMSTLFDFSIF